MAKSHSGPIGDNNYICQRCQKKIRASEAQKEWTGLHVCSRCWEPRHPQDFVPSIHDDNRVLISNNPPDRFVED